MKIHFSHRHSLFTAIIVCYLLPLLYFTYYSIGLMARHKSWSILSLGLLLVGGGTLFLMLCLYYWEQAIQGSRKPPLEDIQQLAFYPIGSQETKVTALDPVLTLSKTYEEATKESTKELHQVQTHLKEIQEQKEQLTLAFEQKKSEFQKLEEENKQVHFKAQQIAQDFADYKLFSEEQLKQKQLQLASLQQMIEDQRTEMEKRQDHIHQLDTKVHDLSYEIKTLLYLHEDEVAPTKLTKLFKEEAFLSQAISVQESPVFTIEEQNTTSEETSIHTAAEAVILLKKCINIAQKLTGANYYGNEVSRYRDFSSSHYAIDQRRLFDSLRSETSGMIVVYSQKENRLVFVNHQVKSLLGWSPEKFTADFAAIIQEGLTEWKKALLALTNSSEAQSHLLAKTRNGQEVLLNCHLGIIPTGLFRNYIIGILYPA
jgi:UPF0242 C-terminal PAS-like domain/Uncharacterised protein family (UPF0242) N-terminus